MTTKHNDKYIIKYNFVGLNNYFIDVFTQNKKNNNLYTVTQLYTIITTHIFNNSCKSRISLESIYKTGFIYDILEGHFS